MNLTGHTLSAMAKARMHSLPHEPLFLGDWREVVMIHFQVDPRALQAVVPFELDLWEEAAFVTLVAFSLRNMRPRFGRWLGRTLLRPLAGHEFLNVRTYVRHRGETGIHFLAEWLNNRLAVRLGPPAFGLPYRLGRIKYQHGRDCRDKLGEVLDAKTGAKLAYQLTLKDGAAEFVACERGTRDEWLMERYTAFNCLRDRHRFFRVWHPPWLQVPARVVVEDRGLLAHNWPFLEQAQVACANYSSGAEDVWMGWPHRMAGDFRVIPTMTCRPEVVR